VQVDLVHGMLGDIHEWYSSNVRPRQATAVGTGATKIHVHSEPQVSEPEIIFSIAVDLPSKDRPYTLCAKATFNPGWMRTQASQLFHCVCGNNDDLHYTCQFQHFPLHGCRDEAYLTSCSAACEPYRTPYNHSANMGSSCIFEGP
jgi:hypothetical protein